MQQQHSNLTQTIKSLWVFLLYCSIKPPNKQLHQNNNKFYSFFFLYITTHKTDISFMYIFQHDRESMGFFFSMWCLAISPMNNWLWKEEEEEEEKPITERGNVPFCLKNRKVLVTRPRWSFMLLPIPDHKKGREGVSLSNQMKRISASLSFCFGLAFKVKLWKESLFYIAGWFSTKTVQQNFLLHANEMVSIQNQLFIYLQWCHDNKRFYRVIIALTLPDNTSVPAVNNKLTQLLPGCFWATQKRFFWPDATRNWKY